jgi:hypothetical protein
MRPLLCTLLLLLAGSWSPAADARADATARLLAGLPMANTGVGVMASDPAWRAHAAEMEQAWQRLQRGQLDRIKVWAPQFMGAAYTDTGPMFYFFSGPDFLYAHALFPKAGTYILCGIEPVGEIPDVGALPRPVLHSALANLRKSLESSLNWSFFITKSMKTDLSQTQLSGTLPVLYVFLARAGCTLESVERMSLDKSGELSAGGAGSTAGVKVVFTCSAGGPPQTLYYFCSNLENDGIKANPGFIKFCERQGPAVSLLKAASYLPHTGGFTRARDFLLTHSKAILQDDSGIPYKYLSDGKWRLRFGGQYAGPIAIFKQFEQHDLATAFAVSRPLPLEFGFGYQWHARQSGVIFAQRRAETPKPASAMNPGKESE